MDRANCGPASIDSMSISTSVTPARRAIVRTRLLCISYTLLKASSRCRKVVFQLPGVARQIQLRPPDRQLHCRQGAFGYWLQHPVEPPHGLHPVFCGARWQHESREED